MHLWQVGFVNFGLPYILKQMVKVASEPVSRLKWLIICRCNWIIIFYLLQISTIISLECTIVQQVFKENRDFKRSKDYLATVKPPKSFDFKPFVGHK